MVRNNNSLSFLKSLLYSDFLILNKKIKKKNSINARAVLLKYVVNNSSSVVLDPVEVLKSLKQFIRILQFLKHRKNAKIQLESKNSQVDDLFDLFFEKSFSNIVLVRNSAASRLDSKFIILVDKIISTQNFKNLFGERYNLVTNINCLDKNKQDFYSYRIYNELDNVKKLLFLFILIRQISLKKSTEV